MEYNLASTLQECLVKELETIFEKVLLKSPHGEYVKPKVFSQRLPLNKKYDDDELKYVPYVLVVLSDFKIEDWFSNKQINVVLVICTYDSSKERRGDRDCHLIMDKVLERFGKNPHLGGYALEMPIEGAFQDEDTCPYFYGALELHFSSVKVETEDDLA